MRRQAIHVVGFAHTNPVPTGCRKANVVVTGGISGLDPESGTMPPSFELQCRNIFSHIRKVMTAAGGSIDDIVKLEVWLADFSNKAPLNKAWLEMFPDPASRPTRHAYSGDHGFAPDVLVVASLFAVLDL